jgi:hypothetical protein
MKVLCHALLLMLAPVVVIQQASPEPADYRLLIVGQPIAQGTVWLYYYGWGYLHRTELGTIQQGAVRIGLQAETLNDINSPQPPDAFLIAIEVPGVGWFRSADFTDPAENLPRMLRSLGAATTARGSDAVAISLQAPANQSIQILDGDGNPRPGMELAISTLVASTNHCSEHMGFSFAGSINVDDVRRVVTDNDGRAQFVAPLEPLYLDAPYYSESEHDGRHTLTMKLGVQLEPERVHVVRQIWERPATRPFRMTITTAGGAAVPGVQIFETDNVASCVASTLVGTTDRNGGVSLDLSPEMIGYMFLGREGVDGTRPLTAQELNDLFENGRVNIKLPPGSSLEGP